MKRSFFMNDAKPSGTNIAHGYVPVGEGFEIRDTYPTFSGSGGLMVTINDLARFDRDIEVGHKVWTPAVSKIMTTPGTFTNGEPALEERTGLVRSEEHTAETQSLMRISYAAFCLKQTKTSELTQT